MLEPGRREALRALFASYDEVRAAYLFGSVAASTERPESDLDLAILLPRGEQLSSGRKLDLHADLVRRGFDDTDLVVLNDADLVTRFEAVRPNQPVYCAPDFSHGAYFSKTLRMYFDFQPYLRIHRKAYKRRLLDGC